MRAPALTLVDLLNGYRVTQALYVAARLGVADRLADGPREARSWRTRRARTRERSGACCARS